MNMAYLFTAIWVGTLLISAITDLRAFRIPNVLPAILTVLFTITQVIDTNGSVPWGNIAHFGVTLLVGMLLFSRGWIGGGDAKLYAATALWFDLSGAAPLVFLTTISGAVLALLFIAARFAGLRKNVPKKDRRIPYGVAIAAGGILTASFLGWDTLFGSLA